jgi:hypothetical protein
MRGCPARPLVLTEDHRAVLDRDLHAALVGVPDEIGPDTGETFEILRKRPVLVVSDERADDLHSELLRRIDHLQEMAIHLFAMLVLRVEVVRVVREGRDLEPVAVEHVADRGGVERVDVDVRDSRVASPLSPTRRPARNLE